MKSTSVEIIEILRKAGHKAYWAGGCVRDILLGKKPHDFDIVTSAKPNEIEKLLEHTIPIGKKFGVILAIKNSYSFEIATFRSDSGYSDGRRPDAVLFTTAEEDAKRRDFTINGMFYDPITDKVFDFVGAKKDLQEKLIRFIGEPETRIKEDYLRILRAVRFKNAFNFQYHPDTYKAIKKNAHLVKKISKERVRDELNKIIMEDKPGQAFEELYELGILQHIIPELVKLKGLAQPLIYHTEGDVWDHTLKSINSLREEEIDPNPLREKLPDLALNWAILFHDIGKYDTFDVDDRIRYNKHSEIGAEIAEKIMLRLKFPQKIIHKTSWLIEKHMLLYPLFDMPKKRRLHWYLENYFEDLLEVFRCDAMGIEPVDLSIYHEIYREYKNEIAKLKLLPKKIIDGNTVMKILNIKASNLVGEILKDIHEKQIEGEIKTNKDAKEYLKKFKKNKRA